MLRFFLIISLIMTHSLSAQVQTTELPYWEVLVKGLRKLLSSKEDPLLNLRQSQERFPALQQLIPVLEKYHLRHEEVKKTLISFIDMFYQHNKHPADDLSFSKDLRRLYDVVNSELRLIEGLEQKMSHLILNTEMFFSTLREKNDGFQLKWEINENSFYPQFPLQFEALFAAQVERFKDHLKTNGVSYVKIQTDFSTRIVGIFTGFFQQLDTVENNLIHLFQNIDEEGLSVSLKKMSNEITKEKLLKSNKDLNLIFEMETLSLTLQSVFLSQQDLLREIKKVEKEKSGNARTLFDLILKNQSKKLYVGWINNQLAEKFIDRLEIGKDGILLNNRTLNFKDLLHQSDFSYYDMDPPTLKKIFNYYLQLKYLLFGSWVELSSMSDTRIDWQEVTAIGLVSYLPYIGDRTNDGELEKRKKGGGKYKIITPPINSCRGVLEARSGF